MSEGKANMNGIWTRGAAAAITITLIVAALRGREGGAGEASVQPLAQHDLAGWSGFRPNGFAPGASAGPGDSPAPFRSPGWPDGTSGGGVHGLRMPPETFVCGPAGGAGNAPAPRAASPCAGAGPAGAPEPSPGESR